MNDIFELVGPKKIVPNQILVAKVL